MVLVVWSRFLFNTEKTLDVNWELNNICNLMCPQCVRNEIVDGKIQWKIDRLNTIDTNLMTFKVAYNNIKHPIRVIRFSGNVSEPLASKEFLEICKWIRYDTDSSVQVHTNGSIRTPEYWKKLGKLFSEDKRSMVFFSIDGVGNKSLQNYRVGADFNKIMENAKAFIDAGGKAMWRMIIFKHNQHQIEDARALAEDMGFWQFITVDTNRKNNMDQMWVHRGKSGILESMEKRRTSNIPDTYNITCRYQEKNKFYVDFLKRVWPCCYIPNKFKNGKEQMWYKEYNEDKTNSLVHKTFDEIMKNEFYEQLQSSWGDDSCLTDCKKFCSQVGRVRKSYWDASELQEKYV